MNAVPLARSAKWRGAFGAAVVAAMILAGQPVADPADPDATVAARRAELAELKQQLERTRREIERLRQEGKQVERLLAQMERERAMAERYIRTLATQETDLEKDIGTLRGELHTREAEIRRLRQGLSAALVQFYKQERLTAAELLISSRNFGELYARAHYWSRAVLRLRAQVQAIEQERAALNSGLTAVEARHAELLAARRERESEVARLKRETDARRRQREELTRDIARQEEESRRLIASQQRIEKLIAEALASASGKGAGLSAMRGKMAWPVRGRVLKGFGTEVHPRYGTQVRHKGIVIAAKEGTPIRAVAVGRVVFVGWLEGYGHTVILDHGSGWFTLYAHAATTSVSKDSAVSAGQEIARVGATDSLDGACLHFEIRRGAEAVDPAAWLQP